MDFTLDKKHEMARQLFRDFAEKEVKPLAIEVDETEEFPRVTVDKMIKAGFMGIPVPKEYGGQGCDPLTYAMCVEELSKVCATTGVIVSAHTSLCIDPIMTFGTEDQKKKYVPDLASGRKIGAFGLTEPGAGTDAQGQQTKAVLDGDEWVINGSKCFITNGKEADVYIVIAVTGIVEKRGRKMKEISSFIVVYRWSGPTEEQRQFAVANWKRMIQIAGDMGVKVINTELSGDPNQQEICNGMWFRSMEELLPLIEREGIRVEIQSHPYDFCELNNETCDMVKSFRSPNLGYVYSSPHGFFYDEGKGDVRSMLKYAGDELTHVLFADTFNQTMDCRYILNPPWLNGRGKADVTVHQHLAMGEGDVDFDGIFETLREMDFASKQLKPDAPKAGGDNIACVSMFGFPEKMDKQAPEARERIERELLGK